MPFAGTTDRRLLYARSPYGSLTATGNLGSSSSVSRLIEGLITFTSSLALSKRTSRLIEGVLTTTGNLGVFTYLRKTVGGVLTTTGALSSYYTTRLFTGIEQFFGKLTRRIIGSTPTPDLSNGQYNDQLLLFFLDNGAVSKNLNDAAIEFLIAQGITPADANDMWFKFLSQEGYLGSLTDMMRDYGI